LNIIEAENILLAHLRMASCLRGHNGTVVTYIEQYAAPALIYFGCGPRAGMVSNYGVLCQLNKELNYLTWLSSKSNSIIIVSLARASGCCLFYVGVGTAWLDLSIFNILEWRNTRNKASRLQQRRNRFSHWINDRHFGKVKQCASTTAGWGDVACRAVRRGEFSKAGIGDNADSIERALSVPQPSRGKQGKCLIFAIMTALIAASREGEMAAARWNGGAVGAAGFGDSHSVIRHVMREFE
jgi:hypothetical protein